VLNDLPTLSVLFAAAFIAGLGSPASSGKDMVLWIWSAKVHESWYLRSRLRISSLKWGYNQNLQTYCMQKQSKEAVLFFNTSMILIASLVMRLTTVYHPERLLILVCLELIFPCPMLSS